MYVKKKKKLCIMNSFEFGSKNDGGNRVDIFRGTANLCVKDNFFRHLNFFKKYVTWLVL